MTKLRDLKANVDAGDEVQRGDDNHGFEYVHVSPPGVYQWDDGDEIQEFAKWEDLCGYTAGRFGDKGDWMTRTEIDAIRKLKERLFNHALAVLSDGKYAKYAQTRLDIGDGPEESE